MSLLRQPLPLHHEPQQRLTHPSLVCGQSLRWKRSHGERTARGIRRRLLLLPSIDQSRLSTIDSGHFFVKFPEIATAQSTSCLLQGGVAFCKQPPIDRIAATENRHQSAETWLSITEPYCDFGSCGTDGRLATLPRRHTTVHTHTHNQSHTAFHTHMITHNERCPLPCRASASTVRSFVRRQGELSGGRASNYYGRCRCSRFGQNAEETALPFRKRWKTGPRSSRMIAG